MISAQAWPPSSHETSLLPSTLSPSYWFSPHCRTWVFCCSNTGLTNIYLYSYSHQEWEKEDTLGGPESLHKYKQAVVLFSSDNCQVHSVYMSFMTPDLFVFIAHPFSYTGLDPLFWTYSIASITILLNSNSTCSHFKLPLRLWPLGQVPQRRPFLGNEKRLQQKLDQKAHGVSAAPPFSPD